jgi:hypothetical protein
MARNPDLESQIDQDPDDPARFLVYADKELAELCGQVS